MKSFTKFTALLFLMLLAATATQAGPDLVFQMGDRVRAAAKTLKGVPSDWRFLVVNDEQWRHMIDKNGLDRGQAQSAVSNLEMHFTFIREGYAVRAPESELRQTIAHEMGHYLCQCTNEDKANSYQDKILRGEIQLQ
jgi:hypothetical protein